jgi:hypothetical protein
MGKIIDSGIKRDHVAGLKADLEKFKEDKADRVKNRFDVLKDVRKDGPLDVTYTWEDKDEQST